MRILLFADIHIGSIKDVTYVYNTITDIIEKEIIFQKTDMVVILGDYFHKLFKTNEDYVALAINVMGYLVRACKVNGTKIRIIYGTESHEMNGYRLFNYHLTSKSVDMKVFDHVTEESIDNHHILYVPEEYVWDKHEYYQKYLYSGNHYDYIFGHGVISDGMPMVVSASAEKNENKEKRVPRFRAEELSTVSDLTIFGHYHVRTSLPGNVYYLGSLFRSSFGEEEPKGYGVIEDKELYFIENTKAYIYQTYEFDPESEVFHDIDSLTRSIDTLKQEHESVFNGTTPGKIRLIFHAPGPLDVTFKETIRTLIGNDPHMTPILKESAEELIEEAKEETVDEYDYILDRSLPIIDKIHTYINKTYDLDMGNLSEYIHI